MKLRALEYSDLLFVHELNNEYSIMSYWFEEPYEAFIELSDLYEKHIHDQSERRFIAESEGTKVGLVSWLKLIMFIVVLSFKSLSPLLIKAMVMQPARQS